MLTIKEPFSPGHFYEGICPPGRRILLFDIETTGFSRESNMIYLIGAASFRNGQWELVQWFAQREMEEADVIRAFLEYALDYDTLIHFNGQRFDLPFTKARADLLNIPWTLSFEESIDLMQMIKPYKDLCGLNNIKQKTIEQMLGIDTRTDTMTGGELIPVYYHYLTSRDSFGLHLLLLHNADDVKDMADLTQIARWKDFFEGSFRPAGRTVTPQGVAWQFESSTKLPILISKDFGTWQISAGGNLLTLGCSFYKGELRHYYPDYKNYYYLPAEHMAIHNSVGEFVDKSQRTRATRENCCTPMTGTFLPQPEVMITPQYAETCRCTTTYFEYKSESDLDRLDLSRYLALVLDTCLRGSGKKRKS